MLFTADKASLTSQEHNVKLALKKTVSKALDWLAPSCCLICQELTTAEYNICPHCYPDTSLRILHTVNSCPVCSEEMALDICPLCILAPLPIDHLRSAWLYHAEVENIIKYHKYRARISLARWMAEQMMPAINSFPTNNWDLLLIIPSTWEHIRARGYIHLLPICRILSKAIEIPIKINALISIKERQTQTQQSITKRFINVSGAFSCDKRAIYGRKVLIVDDVITTGATLSEAARVVRQAGALSIDAISFARSNRFRRYRVANSEKSQSCLEDKIR